ncbi:helix-turn-helix transcriptional regulator [Cochlodiniinecator piscidefendens]|uniref:helix-turn-helix transcriptional regulator n=1 Tax=Cochlodiniinecator piscidefendens TaxID=2715756 RepID=UPI00140AC6A7|nr:LuxR family transcriptional regulator [Cochlodiniinecator piscidefendens]
MTNKAGVDILLQKLGVLAPYGYFLGLHIRYAAPLLQFSTYSQEWLDHYTERAFALRDPTIAWGFSTEGTCRWSEFTIPDPFGLFTEASSFGLNFGLSVSCGPVSSRTIASFAREEREFEDCEIEEISLLVRRLHDITEPPESLTKAQIEALRCIAEGDRYAAAADKLGISESALKARLNGARQKLLARTTAEAIQRAKDYRLL